MSGIGSVSVDLKANTGSFETDFARAARAAKQHSQSISASAVAIGVSIGHFMTEAIESIAHFVEGTVHSSVELAHLAEKTGLSAQALGGLRLAAAQSGIDMDRLGKTVTKVAGIQFDAASGSKQAAAEMKFFGITAKDTADQAVDKLIKGFASLPPSFDRAGLAVKIFGQRLGTDFLLVADKSKDGLAGLEEQARKLGVQLDDKTLKAAEDFEKTMAVLHLKIQAIAEQVLPVLLPKLQALAEEFNSNSSEMDNLKGIGSGLVTLFGWLGQGAEAASQEFRGLVSLVISLGNAMSGLSKLTVPGWLMQHLTGSDGPGDDFRAANDALGQAQDAQRAMLGSFGSGASAAAASHGHAHDARGRGAAADAATGESAALKELQAALGGAAGATHKKSGADKAAADAARRHADAVRELQKQIEEAVQAQKDFNIQMEDLADELAGPIAQENRKYQRALADMQKQEEKAGASLKDRAAAERDLKAVHDKTVDSIKKGLDTGEQELIQMREQLKLMKMTNAERIAEQFRFNNPNATGGQVNEAVALAKQTDGLNKQIAAMDNFRQSAADAFASFIDGSKSAKQAFDDFAKSILAQIAQIIAQKLIAGLFGAQGTAGGGSSGGFLSALFGSANGNAFVNGSPVTAFASGGIIDRPTLFGMAGGRVGIGGEAGTEAIMPLKRGRDGKLGVAAAGRGMVINFTLAGPATRETQAQMAGVVYNSARRAMRDQ